MSTKEIPDKLKKDLAACKFRRTTTPTTQRRVPYPSGALGPSSLTRAAPMATAATMEGKHKAERKLLEEILGRP